jgi:hypothetical protein
MENSYTKIQALACAISSMKIFIKDLKVKDKIIELSSKFILEELEKIEESKASSNH